VQLPSGEHAEDNLDYRTFWQFLLAKGQAREKIPQNRLEKISWVDLQEDANVSILTTYIPGIFPRDGVHFSKEPLSLTM
jgi:hypothetical protein